MSQHDMIISDADGATVLADLNAGLQALASTSKGNSAPATPYAGQPWVDDNTPTSSEWSEFVYDGADWIKKAEIDTTNNLYVPQVGGGTATVASATTTDLGGSFQASVTVSGTTTVTGFGSSTPKGAFKLVTFSGALTLTHNATSLSTEGCLADRNANVASAYLVGSGVVRSYQSGGNYSGGIASFDADGFTVGWTKNSSTTGTMTMYYLAFR